MPPLNTLTGDETANFIDGTVDADAIYGLGGADTLRGLGGDDWLEGGTGADQMTGGIGDDTYVVDVSGDNTIELAGEGTDTVRASLSWTLGANVENLVLLGSGAINGTGNTLDNVLIGNGASNILNGAVGNDWLDGGTGADRLVGGAGNDTYVIDDLGDQIVEGPTEGRDTIRSNLSWVLGADLENLVLTGTDTIDGVGNLLGNAMTGNDAENTLNGLDGNDTLDGGLGADTLIGGLGNDTYVVDNLDDRILENLSEGTDTVRAAFDYVLADGLENLVLSGADPIDGTGNGVANVMTGNAAANHLFGLDGADTLDSQGGGDILEGGEGDDTYLIAGTDDTVVELLDDGTDTVVAGFDYTLGDNLENLTLTGSDAIGATGNALDNALVGNSGANVLTGNDGNDTYTVDNLGDQTVEQIGEGSADTVRSSITWTLADEVERLVLTDTFAIDGTGDGLDNTIDGNDVANAIDGAAGADTMAGHKGDDSYVVDDAGDVIIEMSNEGRDTVVSSVSITLSANVEDITLLEGAAIDATGNAVGNVIRGNAMANVLDGSVGGDDIDGAGGSDIYMVSTVRDHIGNEFHDSGSDGIDEVRIAAIASGSFNLGARETGIERIVVGTGTGAVADSSAAIDMTVSAGRSVNALTIIGNAGANRITGSDFSDVIDGGLGTDSMSGGKGDDSYTVDSSTDRVAEQKLGGIDIVHASATFKLGNNIETLVLTGGNAIDATGNTSANTIDGNEAANRIDGAKGDDIIAGLGGADTLLGGAGNDQIDGGEGNDLLAGGTGNDLLTGGTGADVFRFDASARATSGFDTATDFSRAEGDTIALAKSQYKGIGDLGPMSASAFYSSTLDQAHDPDDRILYNPATGALAYDADGTGGRYSPIVIAIIGTSDHPDLTVSDFFVI